MLVCDLLFLAHHPALVAWLSPPWLFQMLSVLPWVLHQAPSVSSAAVPTAASTGWWVYQSADKAQRALCTACIFVYKHSCPQSRWEASRERVDAGAISATQNPDSMIRGSSGRWNALVNPWMCVTSPCVLKLIPNSPIPYSHASAKQKKLKTTHGPFDVKATVPVQAPISLSARAGSLFASFSSKGGQE